ncbi:Hypothetical predicted protein [Mytilus galloprovincialis]|uniref:Uncharacterized protein n=1 Tax=Mytilus galloprovincialis TaxID=29158 RepID=A0A8B6DYW0_MYTGA|nr:Hypothetical predicted protein [Mytilus galloprovincialis]
MTEATVHYTLSLFSTASSPKSSVAGDARYKMTEPKASRKTSSRAHRLVEDSYHEHFPTDSVRERENDDFVSLAPSHMERHDIGLPSEDEFSLKSEAENPQKDLVNM